MYEKASRVLPATAFSSKIANIHYLLGNSLEKTGNRVRARAEYSAALKIKPNHAETLKALGADK